MYLTRVQKDIISSMWINIKEMDLEIGDYNLLVSIFCDRNKDMPLEIREFLNRMRRIYIDKVLK